MSLIATYRLINVFLVMSVIDGTYQLDRRTLGADRTYYPDDTVSPTHMQTEHSGP